MAVYLSFLEKQSHAQQLIQKPCFMAKNKITINKPVQAHYTVEGVQSYAPQQLKALKIRQQRAMEGKDGTWAPIKTVLLSDQVIEFDQTDPLKKLNKQTDKKEKVKQKPRVQTAKQRVKTNVRNAVSANNQVLIKLQKQIGKKNSLQRKLQKMSQKYKEYFKDVDLKEGLRSNKKKQQIGQQQQQDSKQQQNNGQQNIYAKQQAVQQDKPQEYIAKSFDNFDKTTYHKSSKTNKKKESKKAKNEIDNSKKQQNSDLNQSKNMQLDLGFDLVRQATTYSERLGSAIHQMFK